MDLTFQTKHGFFNYRVGAVIIRQERLLVTKDERSPYFYIPGGRVRLHETAENAILRETREELGANGNILRPLWFCQNFFTEDVLRERFHELCVYYLMEFPENAFPKGEVFERVEGSRVHTFRWIAFDRLRDTYVYPLFLKERIYDLPEKPQFLTEIEP